MDLPDAGVFTLQYLKHSGYFCYTFYENISTNWQDLCWIKSATLKQVNNYDYWSLFFRNQLLLVKVLSNFADRDWFVKAIIRGEWRLFTSRVSLHLEIKYHKTQTQEVDSRPAAFLLWRNIKADKQHLRKQSDLCHVAGGNISKLFDSISDCSVGSVRTKKYLL